MKDSVELFGKTVRLRSQWHSSGQFSFCLADIELSGQARTGPLADIALSHNNHDKNLPIMERRHAHWVRGRLQHIFAFTKSPISLNYKTFFEGRAFVDRWMLRLPLTGRTVEQELTLDIPFICTDFCSEVSLIHGALPDRNAHKYQRLMSSMTHAFVKLLLQEDTLADYRDYHVEFGKRFSFGVRDGVPYDNHPGF